MLFSPSQSSQDFTDFDKFNDVDMLYNTLLLEKSRELEGLVTICPPGLVKQVIDVGPKDTLILVVFPT
ncbi:hypothetical protein Hdeb2414_s0002g00065071 [Helianthus debilis subsp. tardiflorus]